jgi:starch phosphorylase
MKAAMNGAINLSILDGWWDEGYNGTNGWAIGGRETNPDEGAQDWADAQDLYRILEHEVIPRYYERDPDGIPVAWVDLMRRSMASMMWEFSTTRMLREYVELLYLPAALAAQVEEHRPEARRPSRRAVAASSLRPADPHEGQAALDGDASLDGELVEEPRVPEPGEPARTPAG